MVPSAMPLRARASVRVGIAAGADAGADLDPLFWCAVAAVEYSRLPRDGTRTHTRRVGTAQALVHSD